MHALIVVAHHHPRSLTHALAARIAEGVVRAGHSAETADLAAEGFEPRFGLADHAVHRGQASPPADVLAEQARIDRADTLVLVYPIYWWSMPALLKGWIDRVFSNGWAFDYSIGGDLRKKLQRLRVVLVGVGGADAGTFERHGYAGRCAPRSTMASSITAAHGWSVPNCCWNRRPPIRSGIWTRPCTSAASSSPHAARRGPPRRSRWRPDPRSFGQVHGETGPLRGKFVAQGQRRDQVVAAVLPANGIGAVRCRSSRCWPNCSLSAAKRSASIRPLR